VGADSDPTAVSRVSEEFYSLDSHVSLIL